jgi:hypothetical protein
MNFSSFPQAFGPILKQIELHTACEFGNAKKVESLLKDGNLDPNKPNELELETPLHIACRNGHIKVVDLLLKDQRIEPNRLSGSKFTPLMYGCLHERVEVVKMLLKHPKIDLNPSGIDVPLVYMLGPDTNRELAKLILDDPRTDPNQYFLVGNLNTNLLLYTCQYRYSQEFLRYLLQHPKIDPNTLDSTGFSSLLLSIRDKKTEQITLLVKNRDVLLLPPTASKNVMITFLRSSIESGSFLEDNKIFLGTYRLAHRFQNYKLVKNIENWIREVSPLLDRELLEGTQEKFKKLINSTELKTITELTEIFPNLPEELRMIDSLAAEIFGLSILYTDGYLELNT